MRPPKPFSLESGLAELAAILGDYTHEPKVLPPEDARALQASCRLMFERARSIERELDSLRLTRGAELSTRIDAMVAVAAAARQSANVVMFPGYGIGVDQGTSS